MESRVQPSPFHPRPEELPPILPIFPLPGTVLLPWTRLPLNIFEPRYVAMTADALGMGRMIGMVQPIEEEAEGRVPRLFDIGCAGRISAFAETPDGRFLITLTGCLRFRVAQERPQHRGYRLIEPDFSPYWSDLEPEMKVSIDRARLLAVVKETLERLEIALNPQILEGLSDSDLVNAIAMAVPMEAGEKQALLEAVDVVTRSEVLLAILDMARFSGGGETRHQ